MGGVPCKGLHAMSVSPSGDGSLQCPSGLTPGTNTPATRKAGKSICSLLHTPSLHHFPYSPSTVVWKACGGTNCPLPTTCPSFWGHAGKWCDTGQQMAGRPQRSLTALTLHPLFTLALLPPAEFLFKSLLSNRGKYSFKLQLKM